jgi:ribonuclease HI
VEGNELADRMSILAIGEKTVDFVRYRDGLDVKGILAMRVG